MKIESVRSLRGPNLWSDQTLLEAIVSPAPAVDLVEARRVVERALELQRAVGAAVAFADVRPISAQQCRLLIQYREEEGGKRAFELPVQLSADQPLEQLAELTALRALAEEVRLGPSTGSIV